MWGTATSAHQVEGDNFHNDWWAWEEAGRVRERSGLACDHYRRFKSDIALAAELGHNAHRFSIEWSRLEPQENVWDEAAFRHYEEVLLELRRQGLEPMVTLHHFTNPQWFSALGGWQHPDAVVYFNRFVDRAVKAFGAHVRFWITINEPLIYLYHGFLSGLWPPGLQSVKAGLKAFRNQLKAHVEAYRTIHEHSRNDGNRPVWVSIAHHMSDFLPCREDSVADFLTVKLRNYFFNHLILEALQTGFLFLPGVFCEFLSAARTMDFIGVNYYSRSWIRTGWSAGLGIFGDVCDTGMHPHPVREKNSLGWVISPEGFYRKLASLKKYRLPVLVTENGVCTEDDTQRERFIEEHLAALALAKADGVPVSGYFYWSLIDNFEWAEGFAPKFGIVAIEGEEKSRKVRKSAQRLTTLCRNLI